MSGADLKNLTDLVSTIGTLGLVIVAVWAFYTRRVMTKAERDGLVADWQSRWDAREKGFTDNIARMVVYVEERRQEERQGRLDAEHRLGDVIDNIDALTTLLQTVKDEVLRAPSHG